MHLIIEIRYNSLCFCHFLSFPFSLKPEQKETVLAFFHYFNLCGKTMYKLVQNSEFRLIEIYAINKLCWKLIKSFDVVTIIMDI